MVHEKRRAKRFKVSMAITLILHDTNDRLVLDDPMPGELMDISRHGARLSIPHIRTGKYHLFYACNDDPAKILHLEVIDSEKEERFVIPARPVWFDHVLSGPTKHFELGLEFLLSPKDPKITKLHTFLFRLPPREGGWLKRLFRLGQLG